MTPFGLIKNNYRSRRRKRLQLSSRHNGSTQTIMELIQITYYSSNFQLWTWGTSFSITYALLIKLCHIYHFNSCPSLVVTDHSK